MKIAACQMNVVQGDREKNRQTAERMIDEAAQNGARVIVLPEMWTCGYDFARLKEHTEPLDGPTSRWLSEKAKEHQVYLIGGSFPVAWEDGVKNTSQTFDPAGKRVYIYSKIHLIGLMEEDRYLTPGKEYRPFALDQGLAATIICYDLRFPELSRSYAVEGAGLLFVPAQWPVQRESHWLALLRARAIENQCYVVGTNMSGRNANDAFHGRSLVVDPWGEVIAEAGQEPEILYAEIDWALVEEVRKRVPVFQDRAPHLYRCC
jgi:omega-amidase